MAWVRRELESLGIPPLKRFGQHFLIDTQVRDRLVESAELNRSDTVLEVGPGLGFLTSILAAQAGRVIAVEKDRTLASYLRRKFADRQNLTVLQEDALKMTVPDSAKIVSSPPYNISSKLILLILESHFYLASLLLQKEFAGRLIAPSGSRDYGRLTVMFQTRAEAKLVEDVPRTAFYPKPKVDSAIVVIKPGNKPSLADKELFEDMVRMLFTQRRRRLLGVLTRYLKSRFPNQQKAILEQIFVPEKRIFEATIEDLAGLSGKIAALVKESVRKGQASAR